MKICVLLFAAVLLGATPVSAQARGFLSGVLLAAF